MTANPKILKKNIEGFRDHLGIFHPIRSGNKEQGRLYDGQLAGDNDDVFDKEIRRAANQEKAEEIYKQRLLNESLDGALGEERKFSLSQFVRKSGGLKYDPKDKTDNNRGELRMLSFKESKRRGIAHPKGKKQVDYMREAANEAGYPHTRTEAEFLDLLAKDMRTGDVLPFFSADYMTNPTEPGEFWRGKAAEIKKAVLFFKKRNKTAKVNKLEKARKLALELAAMKKKTTPKTKKAPAAKKTAARKPAAKKPAAKKPAAAKKNAPKKNGLIETAAAAAVGISAAVGLADRFSKKKPIVKRPGSSYRGDRDEVENPVKKAKKAPAKKATAKKTKRNTAAKTPVINRGESNAAHHEREFDRLLNLIEKGDTSKIRQAKAKGKLAGYSQNEVDILTHRARLTHRLQNNPAKINIAEAEKLVHNGAVKRLWARGRAVSAYRKQLKLESKLARVKAQRSRQESKARTNTAAKKPAAVKNYDAYYDFTGRDSTKALEVETPEGCPKNIYCLGKLIELRLQGQPKKDFRREVRGRNFYLVADNNNRQLWIAGGKTEPANSQIKPGFSEPIAEITHVIYEQHKAHLDNVINQRYIHEFGEEGGKRPTLAKDRNGHLIIVGGDYTITSLGIKD